MTVASPGADSVKKSPAEEDEAVRHLAVTMCVRTGHTPQVEGDVLTAGNRESGRE